MQSKLIHVHEILEFLSKQKTPLSKQELKSKLFDLFGEVKYATCLGDKFNYEEILEFMVKRNKIIIEDNLIIFNHKDICGK